MTATIVPLRQRGENQSQLAWVNLAAMDLLTKGRTASLQAAQTEVILTDLCRQRDELTALLSDLHERTPTGVPQIEATNTNLITAIDQGIVQIDLFIARARSLLERTAQPRAPSPKVLGETLKGV